MDRQFVGARVMSQRAGTAETEIKALIEVWADAVRRHDLPAILAHHDDDIVMFDVPPPLQSRGLAEYKKTWGPFFAYHQPGQTNSATGSSRVAASTAASRSARNWFVPTP